MNKLVKYATIALLLTAPLAACAASSPRPAGGAIEMKISDAEAHVRTSDYALSVSDRVRVVRRNCTTPGKSGPVCTEKTVSEGVVKQLLNPHFAVIHFAPGADFAEGDRVEKVTSPVEPSP